MIAGIYYRISTADKQEIGMQEKAVKDYCERESIEVYKEYKDEGVSGAKESRPDFDNLLLDMRNRRFDTIIVYELSRFGRSLPHLVKLFEELDKKKIKFISTSQPMFDTTKPEGELFLHIMMALAQYERKNTIRRVKDGVNKMKVDIKERGFAISKEGKKITKLGRPSGSKDKKRRRKGGYYLRWKK